MQRSGFRTMIGSPDTDECFSFVIVVFGIFDDDVPITVFVEEISIEKLEFGNITVAMDTFVDELVVRIGALRVFIEHLHVGMSGGGILMLAGSGIKKYEVIIKLLYIFSMIS